MDPNALILDAPSGCLVTTSGRKLLTRLGINSVEAAVLRPDLGLELRRSPEKSILRLFVDDRTYFLKRCHFHRLSVALRAALKWNFPVFSGPQEAERIARLGGAGFRVPQVLATGDHRQFGRTLSFILLAKLPGQALEDILKQQRPDDRRLRRRARALGELIAALHGRGFIHRDLYLCHILDDPQEGFGLLDLERVLVFKGMPPERWLRKDLAGLAASAAGLVPSSATRAFLLGYYGGPRGVRGARRFLMSVARRAARLVQRLSSGPRAVR